MTDQELLELLGTDPSDASRAQLSGLSRDQLSWLEEIQKTVPVIENPYTKILQSTDNCAVNFDMERWHCNTTHCAAGWIVVHAGEDGEALEEKYDTPTAARMILRKSCPADWPLPNFYASNEAAAAFIHKMAKMEDDANSAKPSGA